ncbi:MAG: nicotinate-nucleotide adenylyltransferase [Gammaproteobacteria bacterium]|nr:nicotinate-nucleotide adenylyltransferase [Gammaproteobacteria bacterium]
MKAILGGTFDPVHLGHLHAGRRARAALDIPNVTLLLAARPGHRTKPQASIGDRWRMLELATGGGSDLLPSDREAARPGPSYTVDTLEALRRCSGDGKGRDGASEPLVWLIGRDALADVPSWHRADELASLCHLLVLDRPGSGNARWFVPTGFECVDTVEGLAKRPNGGLYSLADAMLDVSASQVRQTVSGGGDASALLPPDVWSYIKARGLYRSCDRGWDQAG